MSLCYAHGVGPTSGPSGVILIVPVVPLVRTWGAGVGWGAWRPQPSIVMQWLSPALSEPRLRASRGNLYSEKATDGKKKVDLPVELLWRDRLRVLNMSTMVYNLGVIIFALSSGVNSGICENCVVTR